MKKKLILMGVAAALVITTLIGGAIAYFQSDGGEVQQSINTQSLSISLDNASDVEIDAEAVDLAPGSEIKQELYITNTNEVTLYARVTIQKYWVRTNEEEVEEKDLSLDSSMIQLVTEAEANGWLVVSSDDEELVMYYTSPITQGESSTNFLEGLFISTEIGNEYADTGIKLTVSIDAIQEYSVVDAILSEWGVLATLDEDGNITMIEE